MINSNEILLLDDNDDTNFYNQDVVMETELFDDITVFSSPARALEELENRLSSSIAIPGSFLIDIRMPLMDGFEFLDEFEQLLEAHGMEEAPRIMILTTSKHKRDLEKYERSTMASGYIVKPLMPASITEAFKND